jgi:hypothetical protein
VGQVFILIGMYQLEEQWAEVHMTAPAGLWDEITHNAWISWFGWSENSFGEHRPSIWRSRCS